MLQAECRINFHDEIILCKLGSVYRAFKFLDANRDCQSIRPSEYFNIDEVSEVYCSGNSILLSIIAYSSEPYEVTSPRLCFVGDSYQFPPNTQSQRPPCNYYTKLSFLERMTPESSPFLRVLNKIPTVQLNMQYHMVP